MASSNEADTYLGQSYVEEVENAELDSSPTFNACNVYPHTTCLATRPRSLQLCEKYVVRTIFGGGGSLMVGNAVLPLLLTSELKFWLFRV